jgi:hypothetical protein
VQLALLGTARIAEKVADKIALASLTGKELERDNAHRRIASGLTDAQNMISTVFKFEIIK